MKKPQFCWVVVAVWWYIASLFVVRPTNQMSMTQILFRWVQEPGCRSDTHGGSQNALGSVGILLKRDALGARK